MTYRVKEPLTVTNMVAAGMSILILILISYPLLLLIAFRVPFGWSYFVAWGAWAAFAVLLAWLNWRSTPTRTSRWPHQQFAWISFGGFFLYGVLGALGLLRLGLAGLFFFVALFVWMLVEGAFVGREKRLLRAQRQKAKIK
jgi:hypothetical protein